MSEKDLLDAYKKEIITIMKNDFHATNEDFSLLSIECIKRNFNLKRKPYDVAWAIMQ